MELSVIFKIATVGIITSVINMVLKKSDKDEFATVVTIVGLVIVLVMMVGMISELFEDLMGIFRL